jgi:protocatechuate 3,4-dioxygenase alpha subunit
MSETKTPELTSSQTIGPFFKYGLAWEKGEQAFPADAAGEKIEISGRLIDGAGAPINDSMIEFWQADGSGKFGGPVPGSCAGFARANTDAEGRFRFTTRKPAVPAGEKGAAPHILVCLFSRGMLKHLYTRLYFEGEAANAGDPVLKAAGERAATLIAAKNGAGKYSWDIVLQGGRETVFLDF